MEGYRTIRKAASAEIVIKRSRFIAELIPVNSPEEAARHIAAIKKEHYNARHSCSAMIIGKKSEFLRCSDDGEPQGTAGVPMLEVLKQNGLTDVLVVVTRYFGGILLGAGGLVRAYSDAAAEAVRAAEITEAVPHTLAKTVLSFGLWARAEGSVRKLALVQDIEYGENVTVTVAIPIGREEALNKTLAEISAGGAALEILGNTFIDVPVGTGKQD